MLADIPRNRQADQSHPSHALPSAPTWQPLDVLELAQEAIVVRNADGGTIRFWNRSAELLYGWSRQDALGQVAHRLLATQFPLPLCQIEAELRDTGRWQGELIHTTPDGRRLTVASRWILQRDEQGRRSACVELGTDVTDRGLAAIIASAYDAIYGKDLDGTITSWNPAAERLYGYAASEASGQSIELIVPLDRVQELAGLMRRSHQGRAHRGLGNRAAVQGQAAGRRLDQHLAAHRCHRAGRGGRDDHPRHFRTQARSAVAARE